MQLEVGMWQNSGHWDVSGNVQIGFLESFLSQDDSSCVFPYLFALPVFLI